MSTAATSNRATPWVRALAIVVVTLIAAFPFVWMLLASFKHNVQISDVSQSLVFSPTLDNYVSVLETNNYFQYFVNSLTISHVSPAFGTRYRYRQHSGDHLQLEQLSLFTGARRYEYFDASGGHLPVHVLCGNRLGWSHGGCVCDDTSHYCVRTVRAALCCCGPHSRCNEGLEEGMPTPRCLE